MLRRDRLWGRGWILLSWRLLRIKREKSLLLLRPKLIFFFFLTLLRQFTNLGRVFNIQFAIPVLPVHLFQWTNNLEFKLGRLIGPFEVSEGVSDTLWNNIGHFLNKLRDPFLEVGLNSSALGFSCWFSERSWYFFQSTLLREDIAIQLSCEVKLKSHNSFFDFKI